MTSTVALRRRIRRWHHRHADALLVALAAAVALGYAAALAFMLWTVHDLLQRGDEPTAAVIALIFLALTSSGSASITTRRAER